MVKLSIEKGLKGLGNNGSGASDQDEEIIAEKATFRRAGRSNFALCNSLIL
jgi:hypothetical protein